MTLKVTDNQNDNWATCLLLFVSMQDGELAYYHDHVGLNKMTWRWRHFVYCRAKHVHDAR